MLRFLCLLVACLLASSACSGSSGDNAGTSESVAGTAGSVTDSTEQANTTEPASGETTAPQDSGPCDGVALGRSSFELVAGGAVYAVQLYLSLIHI